MHITHYCCIVFLSSERNYHPAAHLFVKNFDTILEDEDGVLYVTEGIADDFTSDHETNIIRKDGDT